MYVLLGALAASLVTVAYVIRFLVMLTLLGWQPDPPHRRGDVPSATQVAQAQ